MDVIIYGCGENGMKVLDFFEEKMHYNVFAYIDKNKSGRYREKEIIGLDDIYKYDFDWIIISLYDFFEVESIRRELISVGIKEQKIRYLCYDSEYVEFFSDSRSDFIKDCSLMMDRWGKKGEVAECGVFRGDSARFINFYFKDRKLYLFDTFDGFEQKDIEFDKNAFGEGFDSTFFTKETFENTSVNIVKAKMTNVKNVIFKKGYFPESAKDIEEQFCFVNLDMDLYSPMLAGLEFFYNKMVDGGIILLHDYFDCGLDGVKAAVHDFEINNNLVLKKMPIGDHLSIAIVK